MMFEPDPDFIPMNLINSIILQGLGYFWQLLLLYYTKTGFSYGNAFMTHSIYGKKSHQT